MNNIIISHENEIKLQNCEKNIEIKVPKLDIYISGDVVLNELTSETNTLNLNIYIEDNSTLTFNKFALLNKYELDVLITQNNNSNFTLNYSFIAEGNVDIKIKTNLKGNANNSNTVIRGVSEGKGNIKIEATGEVNMSTKDNNLVEDIRCLTLGDNPCMVIPNMLINTENVTANHFVTIGNVDKNELFYLNSKGISNKEAIKLLKNGFILNNLDVNEENLMKIKEIIN